MAGIEGGRVLITGASGGIGAEVAKRMAERGARLALSGRRAERLAAVATEIESHAGTRPEALTADLGKPGEAARLAAAAEDALGGVDVLINNAGANLQGLTWVAGDGGEAREVFETNFWSPMALVAAVTPPMLERGSGTIVNVGSMIHVSPFPHLGHTAASKAALAAATQVLRLELGRRGVAVVEIALGPVDTATSRENRALAGADRWLDGRPGLGRVEGAAAAIVAAAERGADGIAFYPHVLRWVHRLPGLGRRYARRMAADADIADRSVRLGGSAGNAELRALREDWDSSARNRVSSPG